MTSMAQPPREVRTKETLPAALPWRLVGAVVAGTLLNALNSSMIAVALLSLQDNFRVSTITVTWVISSYYLAAAIGMPLMGRLADQFGPRRIFCVGLLLVGLTGIVAGFAPSFGWLLGIRVAQALGTSAAYPAGLAIFRARDPRGRTPANALGAISIASSVSAALGPVLGGFLVAFAGWQAIFLVNLPFVVVGLALALLWLPADATGMTAHHTDSGLAESRWAGFWMVARQADLPGILLFSAMLASLLGFLLSLGSALLWPLVPVAVATGVLLVWRERNAGTPFLNIRLLTANRQLVMVYAQFAAVNVVFYTAFFGLPLWLEQARRFNADTAGLLLLPIAGVGIVVTPFAARLINRSGARPSLIIGAVTLLAGSLLLLLFGPDTVVIVLLAVGAVLGVPNGFNNLGLQAALYEHAPPDQMGAAGGQFQTFRYIGATLSTALLGIVFGSAATSTGLHTLAVALAGISALLVVASLTRGR